MLDELQVVNLFPKTGSELLLNITVALLCGIFIGWIYRLTYKGPGYSNSFVNSTVILSMITALVIMAIGNNLARAFGLVGAMSIIRFRTAVKDTQDIIYIFFALSVGMAAGVGYHKLAITGTLYIGLVLFFFSKTNMAAPKKKEYLLQFSYSPNGEDTPLYIPVLKKHCRRYKVINVKSLGDEQQNLELSYYVKLKEEQKSTAFTRELQQSKGVNHLNLFFDEEQI